MEKNGEKVKMSEIENKRVFYSGGFTRPLDEKRRFTIPAKWRFEGDNKSDSFLAIPNTYGSISVLPPPMVERLYDVISKVSLANPAKRRAISVILEQSESFGCDKQGRVMLGENMLSHAEIGKEARLVGAGTTFEIWNPERRQAVVEEETSAKGVDVSSALEEIGF